MLTLLFNEAAAVDFWLLKYAYGPKSFLLSFLFKVLRPRGTEIIVPGKQTLFKDSKY
jgi:hypothetical protein